mmetsp:Transcript_46335/g.143516  ORF Transcript_46335/g.143516 Transcript_46335/m.143516 type:complete len:115 (+) Transcript_46335:50-394(+)
MPAQLLRSAAFLAVVATCSRSVLLLASADAAMRSRAPSFAKESCAGMFETMQKLGGPVPPSDFVVGCNEVCAKVKEMKEFWGSGEGAAWACEKGKEYGCVWAGTPPATLRTIGC